MLELLSPAGSPEAVVAAVQSGADAIYMGLGNFNARRGAKNFTDDEFQKAVRYCRIRGCKVYVTLNTLVSDREIAEVTRCARLASKCGADGIIIQDLGLIKVLKNAVPDMPLHGSTQMSVHNLAGAEACAQMGLKRVVLARELSYDQIKFISQNCSIETEIFVHGALCFCHSGQCYMSSLIGRRSGNRGMCAQPCRMQYSLGGRLDDYPLSLKDNCLVDELDRIEQAGVACIKIEGRMKRPEYTATVTKIYSDVLKEGRKPTDAELETLKKVFSRDGFTKGYFDASKEDMFGVRPDESSSELNKFYAETKKGYSEGELRRVPLHIYTVCEKEKPLAAIAFDEDGNKASVTGKVPQEAKTKAVTDSAIIEQMFKTGGTPYNVIENKAKCDEGLFVSAGELNGLRRELIEKITAQRSRDIKYTNGAIPPMPKGEKIKNPPKTIYQVRTQDHLSTELAELSPDYLYVPLELLNEHFDLTKPFTDAGCKIVGVFPRIISDSEVSSTQELLASLFEKGLEEVLVGNIGHIYYAKKAGFDVRGDFGLNVFNSFTVDVLKETGLISTTASFELRLNQIRDLSKTIDTEAIVYGRLPLMVSDQCVIKKSAGRCLCTQAAQLSDRMGSSFPVVKETGCRNVIYNAHKLYLADKKSEYESCGLWGARLMFTTESARECVEVAKGYKGLSDYKPNVLTRGLYFRGVE